MKTVMEEPVTNRGSAPQTDRACRQDEDEAEIARGVERAINEAKESISDKFEEVKTSAERLLKHGRYAAEDGLSELTHQIKKHPLGFLGIAFAAGAVFGLLMSRSSEPEPTE